METEKKQPPNTRSKALVKAGILIAFIVLAISLIRFTPIKDYLTAEALGNFLETAGHWAPVLYMLIYAIGVCLFLPGTLLTGLGAAIFGAYWGFLYVWIGAMLGASAAFFIGRTLGREFAASLIGDRLKKYDDAIERNGFDDGTLPASGLFPIHAHEFRHGSDQGQFQGLFCWYGTRYYCRDLYLHLFYRDPERGVGIRQLG